MTVLVVAEHDNQTIKKATLNTVAAAQKLGGDIHVPDKVLSVLEPHTVAIRKGKIAKPTEFGKLVTIQES